MAKCEICDDQEAQANDVLCGDCRADQDEYERKRQVESSTSREVISMNRRKVKSLGNAFKRMREYQSKAAQLTREAFPIGCEVQYRHGQHLRTVEVTGHMQHDYLQLVVRGVTGREYQLQVWEILYELLGDGFDRPAPKKPKKK